MSTTMAPGKGLRKGKETDLDRLSAEIIKALEDGSTDAEEMAFQSNDFASDMFGKYKGTQAKVEHVVHSLSVPWNYGCGGTCL